MKRFLGSAWQALKALLFVATFAVGTAVVAWQFFPSVFSNYIGPEIERVNETLGQDRPVLDA